MRDNHEDFEFIVKTLKMLFINLNCTIMLYYYNLYTPNRNYLYFVNRNYLNLSHAVRDTKL